MTHIATLACPVCDGKQFDIEQIQIEVDDTDVHTTLSCLGCTEEMTLIVRPGSDDDSSGVTIDSMYQYGSTLRVREMEYIRSPHHESSAVRVVAVDACAYLDGKDWRNRWRADEDLVVSMVPVDGRYVTVYLECIESKMIFHICMALTDNGVAVTLS